jgi:hypothetical protein
MSEYRSTNALRKSSPWYFHPTKVISLLAALIIVALIGVVFLSNSSSASADSGVTACSQMAERQKAGTKSTSKTMDEASYHKARQPFEDTKFVDLKTAGTDFVDAVYDGQKALAADDTPLQSSMGVITKVSLKYSSLQLACSNHGVQLADLGG